MSCKDRLTIVCWFGFGLSVYYPAQVLLWIATEDILAGSLQSSAIVLIAFAIPEFLSKAVISPWLVDRIAFLPAFIILGSLYFTVQMSFVLVNIVNVRLAGMCVVGFAHGLGAITAAKLLGFYGESAGVYQSGINFSAALASITYTGLTTWACLPPRIVIAILSPLSLFPLLIYALLDKEPLKAYKTSAKEIMYKTLDEKDNDFPSTYSLHESKRSTTKSDGQQLKHGIFNEFLVCYYRYLTNSTLVLSYAAILSTVTFKSSPFPPRDHYQYYRFLSDTGMMLGGIESSLVSFFCPRFLDTIKIRRIWILMLLLIGHMMVFLSVSWFHYTDNVYIIFILCFTQGVVMGCALVNTFCLAADLFPDSRKLGKVLGYLEVSISVSRLSGVLVGIFVEEYLREHCEHRLLLGRLCLARLPSPGMWSTSNCAR